MKVIFVDIDGVLNSEPSRLAAHQKQEGDWGTHRAWLPEAVAQLKRIIAETGCQIVISSDWRLPKNIESLREGFKAFDLPEWIGITPILGFNTNRGQEVKAWIDTAKAEGKEIESFAIVDDNDWFLLEQQDRKSVV
jgi:hypothetical protein